MIARHLCAAYSRLSLTLRANDARVALEARLRALAGSRLPLRFVQGRDRDALIVGIDDRRDEQRRAVAALVRHLDSDPDVRSVRWERVPC